MTYEMIKRNYDKGLWNAKMVATAVRKGIITVEQYQTITGDIYTGDVTATQIIDILTGDAL